MFQIAGTELEIWALQPNPTSRSATRENERLKSYLQFKVTAKKAMN